MQRGVLAAVCALVIGVYAYTAHSGYVASARSDATDDYYNLLVQGFRAGQLNLKKEVPPGLAQLADPYDPTTNARFCSWPDRLLDLSYYQGKFYLYFGVTPAVVLFWPFAAVTGHYLSQKDAGVIFCVVGFLTSVGLLCALWRRYFAEVSVAVVAAGALALGLATFIPLLLARCDVYEVSISCGYALVMLALAAIWKAFHEPGRRGWWLAAASLAYGLAVGARPSLLFGAVILPVPVVQTWREHRKNWVLVAAATGPIILIGAGLMLYNELRFGNPFEFGEHYELAGTRQVTRQLFSLHYLWFNFRVYFLEPAHWTGRFPFVHDIRVPPLPMGQGRVEHPFGILSNVPLVWLALALPLAWRGRSADARSTLCGFVAVVAALFGIATLTVSLFWAAINRYEVDFLPALVLLAVIGILGLERALAPTSESGLADRTAWRCAVRWGWALLLVFSVAFNLLACVARWAEAEDNWGVALAQTGKIQEAIPHFERILRIDPDYYDAYTDLGAALRHTGRFEDAIKCYEQVLRIKPDFVEAHTDLGLALAQTGKFDEAIAHYEQALRIWPDYAEALTDLGLALAQTGKIEEAIKHYEQALRIKPDYAEAHCNLGIVLAQMGKIEDAIQHYERALRTNPDFAEAHIDLGAALAQTGKFDEAIQHYEQALRINPGYYDAHTDLGVALARTGKFDEAIQHFEQALRIKPDFTEAHYNLAVVLAQTGKFDEAIEHFEQVLRIKPDYAEAHNNLGVALLRASRVPEAIGHFEQALRINPDFADAHYNLGVALLRAGRVPEAIEQLEQALRIKPDFAEARSALAQLQARQ